MSNDPHDIQCIHSHSAFFKHKRCFDIIFSILGLFLLSPVILIIYLAQKTTSNSSAFFLQERVGKGGRPFHIIKFRTMKETEEIEKPQLTNTTNTQQCTCIGAFLRRTHLDEIPQLWNVLKGDMSLVGYRPERKYFIDKILQHDSRYTSLYCMRPGITSEATIYNGYTDTMEKMLIRLEMDLAYIEKSSLKTDIVIILKTFGLLFNKKN